MSIQERIDEGRNLLNELRATRPIPFREMTGQCMPAKSGLYVIYNSDTREFLYAGKSTNLRRRIWNDHRTGTESSDFVRILANEFGSTCNRRAARAREWIEKHCEVYLMTEDQIPFNLKWAENFMISVLRPKYNKQ